jgi:hypothetical protein
MGLLAFAVMAACGGSNGGGDGFPVSDASTSTPDSSAPADDGSIVPGNDGSLIGTGDTSPPQLGCSADLHDVIDGSGQVVQVCPAAQGCAGGTCVPACQAAGASHGNIGCDFQVATPSFFADYSGHPTYYSPCFAVFLANNWGTPMTIAVTRSGMSYDATTFGRIPVAGQPETSWTPVPATGVPPGQVAVLFLEESPSTTFTCPVTPALSQGTAVQGTGVGAAWHIVTGAPVSAYDVLPYGGASSLLPSAELLFPTSAWGTNYITVVPKLASGGNDSEPGPQWGQILAMQNGTQVKIVPTVALPAGTGVVAAPANAVTMYTLNEGEFLQWQNPYTFAPPGAAPMEMSGSIVSSNFPVAFMAGNGYLCLGSSTDTAGGGCDSGHQQIAPVSALGYEYAPAPYTTRRADLMPESLPYRIVGTVNGTTLTYDPPVAGAPVTLSLGQYVDFEATGAFDVKSQDAMHPFYLGQMMTGCEVTSGSRPPGGCIGDEEYVNVMPPAQFLSSYVFFTDPTYPTTTFTFVRNKGPSGFADVTVDCMPAALTGWQPVGTSATKAARLAGGLERERVETEPRAARVPRDAAEPASCPTCPCVSTVTSPLHDATMTFCTSTGEAPAGDQAAHLDPVHAPLSLRLILACIHGGTTTHRNAMRRPRVVRVAVPRP